MAVRTSHMPVICMSKEMLCINQRGTTSILVGTNTSKVHENTAVVFSTLRSCLGVVAVMLHVAPAIDQCNMRCLARTLSPQHKQQLHTYWMQTFSAPSHQQMEPPSCSLSIDLEHSWPGNYFHWSERRERASAADTRLSSSRTSMDRFRNSYATTTKPHS